MAQPTQDKTNVWLNSGGVWKSPNTLLTRMPDLSLGVPSTGGWSFGTLSGATITVDEDETGFYLKGTYPPDASGDLSGANYIFGGWTPTELLQELYITIYARMPGYKMGIKFCKIFGDVIAGEYANATFGTDYSGGDNGAMLYAAYGDGTTPVNDTQNGLEFNEGGYISTGRTGSLTQTIERNGAFTSADWGTDWHKFQIHHKFNSGTSLETETNDGISEVYVDGILLGRAINVFNRHYTNAFAETINFFGYSRSATETFEMHMKGITVSENNWVD